MVIKSGPWDAPELLELNRQRLVGEARQKTRAFESRYGLDSSDLEAALASGRIRETPDVGEWLFGMHTYRSLTHA